VHIWVADGVNTYATLHVVVSNVESIELPGVKKYVRETLAKQDIGHVTIEIEFENERCKEDSCEFEMSALDSLHQGHHHHH
jgi:cobalt-zinc-cadmium efflux system protein